MIKIYILVDQIHMWAHGVDEIEFIYLEFSFFPVLASNSVVLWRLAADRIHARWSRTDAPIHIGKLDTIFRCRKSARMQTTFVPDPFLIFLPLLLSPRPSSSLRSMWHSFRISSNNSRSIPSNYISALEHFASRNFGARAVWPVTWEPNDTITAIHISGGY